MSIEDDRQAIADLVRRSASFYAAAERRLAGEG
jgi:hypothetical protein